mgnify:CR=1 FL=1
MIKFIIFFIPIMLLASEITPIPLNIDYDKKKAELGKKLFFDVKLSKDDTVSCASCHNLTGNGANLTAFSFGVNGVEGKMNSPTVLNSVFNFAQFWNGRATRSDERRVGKEWDCRCVAYSNKEKSERCKYE